MIEEAFLTQSRRLLTDSYLPRIEQAVGGLSDEQVWWRANHDSNSVGNLILHLTGNVRQWIMSGIGGAADDQAIYTVIEHFSMHTGQIIALAKMWKGDLGFYQLSHGTPHPAWRNGKDGD